MYGDLNSDCLMVKVCTAIDILLALYFQARIPCLEFVADSQT